MIKKGLGRGFETLIPDDVLSSEFDATADLDEKISDLRVLALSAIAPSPQQPRRHFDDQQLALLAESIREHGVLQPIVVAPSGRGFEIVAGERRWRAAGIAGLKKIPAIIRTLSAQHKLELSIIENVQRADLNPLEMATAYLKLKTQFNLTDAEIAARVGKAASTISNLTRLLALPEFAKTALVAGQISEGHARQILALSETAAQRQLLDEIIKHGWSVRKAEQFVIGYKNPASSQSDQSVSSGRRATLESTELTKAIAARLGLSDKSVRQKITAHGGQIIIKFTDQTELKTISQLIGR